jgi:ubiquinone/menaquinone biosynthesis C-methylase UbiE
MNRAQFEQHLRTLPPKAKVLDAGCGTGHNSRYALFLRPDLKITGLDIDPSYKKDVPKEIAFTQGDVNHLKKFKTGSLDAVICFHLIEHLPDPPKAISEFQRVLKKGGILFVEAPHWICTLLPIGTNFWDDPTHLRPHSRASFAELFKNFSVQLLETDEPIMFFLPGLYNIPQGGLTNMIRSILSFFGLFRIAVFLIAKKDK